MLNVWSSALGRVGRVSLAITGLLCLSGCAGKQFSLVSDKSDVLRFSGIATSAHLPLRGAEVQVYAAGTPATAMSPRALLYDPVKTDKDGHFALPANVFCPSRDAVIYLVAKGGTLVGAAPRGSSSPALMAAIGPCSSAASVQTIRLDEATTIASVWLLKPYFKGESNVSSDDADTEALGQAAQRALILAESIQDPSTKTADTSAKLGSLANALSRCFGSINTPGDSAGCFRLSALKKDGLSTPSNPIFWALSIARHPELDVQAIFALSLAEPLFQPSLSQPPADWTLALPDMVAASSSDSGAGVYATESVNSKLTTVHPTSTSVATGEVATSAAAFMNTLGINTHLSFGGTLYTTNFPLILSSLQDLRIHHVRDGLADFGPWQTTLYNNHQLLAAQGIRCLFVTSVGQTASLIQAYPQRVSDMEAVEGPNEYDTSGNSQWAASLNAFLPILSNAVHGLSPMTGVSLFGPSLVDPNWYATNNSYAQLSLTGTNFDAGSLHNYPDGRNPGTAGWTPQGYGSIDFALSSARQAWVNKPFVTTETGYLDDSYMPNSVPDSISARYIPRIFLEQFLHGIQRTYLYELADDAYSGGSYGLLKADGSKKPGYVALSAMTHLLDDPGTSYVGTSLDWSITGADASVHHLLFSKRDGSMYLALWIEAPAYDVDARKVLTVPSQSVRLQFAQPVSVSGIDRWQADGSMVRSTNSATAQTSLALSVSDLLTIVEVGPATATN